MTVNKEQLQKFDEAVDELIKSVGLETEEDETLKKSVKAEDKEELKKGKASDEGDEDLEEDDEDLEDEDLGDEDEEDEDEDEDEDDCATEKDFRKPMKKSVSLEDEEEYLEVSPFLKSFASKLVKSLNAVSEQVAELTKANAELKAFNKKLVKAISANGEVFKSVASQSLPQKSKTLVKSNGTEKKEDVVNTRQLCDTLLKGIEAGKLNPITASGMIAQIEATGEIPKGAMDLAKSVM